MAGETEMQQYPHRERRKNAEGRGRFMLRQIMNLLFIVGVIILMIYYFAKPGIQNNPAYIMSGMFVVLVKIAEMIIRYLPK